MYLFETKEKPYASYRKGETQQNSNSYIVHVSDLINFNASTQEQLALDYNCRYN